MNFKMFIGGLTLTINYSSPGENNVGGPDVHASMC